MSFRTQKISQMTPKGANLAATDLIEVSTIKSGSYVTRSITGQELIDAVPPTTVDWGDIGGTLSAQTDLNTALSGKVPNTRTLTINGTAYDLSADRSWTIATGLTIGSTAIASGTNGRVLFQGTGNVLQQSSSLFWDNTNTGISILSETSTSADRGVLIKQFNTGVQGALGTFQKSRGTIASPSDVAANDLVGLFQFSARVGGSYTSDRAIFGANMASSTGIGLFFSAGSTNGSYIPSLYIHPSGNAIFGSTQSILTGITDAGYKLDVNGTARVQGATEITHSGGTMLTMNRTAGVSAGLLITNIRVGGGQGLVLSAPGFSFANGSTKYLTSDGARVGIYTNDDALLASLHVKGLGSTSSTKNILFRNSSNTDLFTIWDDGAIGVNTSTNAGYKLDVNGTARVQGRLTVGTASTTGEVFSNANTTLSIGGGQITNAISIFQINDGKIPTNNTESSLALMTISQNNTGGGNNFGNVIRMAGSVTNTVNTNTFNNIQTNTVINTTGGTTTYRGFYHNPTLTATTGVTHYAIHSTSGRVRLEGLPTSSAGLSAGDLWNDGGTLKIV